MDSSNLLTCYSRTTLFKYTFINRVVGEWNRLPHDIMEATSVADFMSKVSRFLAHCWISVYIVFQFFIYILGLKVVWGFLLEWCCAAFWGYFLFQRCSNLCTLCCWNKVWIDTSVLLPLDSHQRKLTKTKAQSVNSVTAIVEDIQAPFFQ